MEDGMSSFLDQLKARSVEAQKRVAETQQQAQAAQALFQSAAQEFNSLQLLVNLESAREAKASPQAKAAPVVERPAVAISEGNKTELVRNLIFDNPEGLTPPEIWKRVGAKMVRRQYLYSVLKRLKDREIIVEKRGKYFQRIATKAEGETQQTLLQ
jgi:hypothetical protein